MDSTMKRRAWILGGTLAIGGAAGLFRFNREQSRAGRDPKHFLKQRSGPVAVREGFQVTVLSRAGELLSDGSRSADLPDGMACFALSDGSWALLRNHELMTSVAQGAYPGGAPPLAYRNNVQGGVSRLVLDPKTLGVRSSNMILTGTLRNCGGGPSPWGWISCEEAFEPGHGYAFLCHHEASKLQKPNRILGFGRFRHEAVAFDERSGQAFLTEDETDSCFYRFTPHSRSTPFEGRLEALRVPAQPHFNTGEKMSQGASATIDWVPIQDASAKKQTLREQASQHGAARFTRGEGAWMDGNGVVFTATTGGTAGVGQVFRLDLDTNHLTVVAEADGSNLNSPDNITVAQWGDLVVAEDNLLGVQHLVGVTASGATYPILRNEGSSSELAGVCFSPDGSTLFCNIQGDGLTLALQGPWETLRDNT